MTQQEVKNSFAKHRPRLFMSLVAAGLVGALALIALPSMLRYMAASSALARMKVQIVNAGGVAINTPRAVHGGFWWFQNVCIDNPCPTIRQDFLIPLEVGKEEVFMRQSLLSSQGYNPLPSNGCQIDKPGVLCLESGVKGRASIFMSLDPAATKPDRIPNRDVKPKVWRTLSISSY
jgi:hypothetical protein